MIKIVKQLSQIRMSPKYHLNSSTLTLCSCEMNICVLFQLWHYIVHLRLVMFDCLFEIMTLVVYLWFIFVMHTCLFPFKFVKVFIFCTELLVKSRTIFLSSSINLSARTCFYNFGTISWLWIPIRVTNFQVFNSLLTYPHNLNIHPRFFDLIASYFNFFFGILWSSLISQTNSNIGFFILDLLIKPINSTLFVCRHIQPSNSSLSFYVSWLENKWVVYTSLTPSWDRSFNINESVIRIWFHINRNFNLRRFDLDGIIDKPRFCLS